MRAIRSTSAWFCSTLSMKLRWMLNLVSPDDLMLESSSASVNAPPLAAPPIIAEGGIASEVAASPTVGFAATIGLAGAGVAVRSENITSEHSRPVEARMYTAFGKIDATCLSPTVPPTRYSSGASDPAVMLANDHSGNCSEYIDATSFTAPSHG